METVNILSSGSDAPRSGVLARLANVVIDPVTSFRAVAADPRWLAAFAAVILLRFVSLFVFYQPSATPAKLVVGFVFQIVTTAPLLVVLGLVLWTCSRVYGVRVAWPVAFAITVHVYFAYTLATVAVASIAGAVLPSSVDVDLRNPPFTNLGTMAPADAGMLRGLLTWVDVRSGYAFALVMLGLRASVPDVSVRRVTLAVASAYGVLLAATVMRVGSQ